MSKKIITVIFFVTILMHGKFASLGHSADLCWTHFDTAFSYIVRMYDSTNTLVVTTSDAHFDKKSGSILYTLPTSFYVSLANDPSNRITVTALGIRRLPNGRSQFWISHETEVPHFFVFAEDSSCFDLLPRKVGPDTNCDGKISVTDALITLDASVWDTEPHCFKE